ncbi:MAG: universal stress protein [Candidatus Limnocylindrales bacterium]
MRLLIATDGSASADRTLDLVLQEAWGETLTVRVVTVLDVAAMSIGSPWPVVPVPVYDIEGTVRSAGEETLARAVARLTDHVAVESAVLFGRAGSTIAAEARRWGADAILIGSRGHGALSTMLLGSVSAEVIDAADRPVLVARADHVDRVVLGVDGSAGASAALDVVLRWPVFRALPIHVVSVTPSAHPWWVGMAEAGSVSVLPEYLDTEDALRDEEAGLVEQTVARLEAAGCHATGEVREGDAAERLIASARATHSDLIITGTHGRTGLDRLVMGSVARNVMIHAGCSVLIVHQPIVEHAKAA